MKKILPILCGLLFAFTREGLCDTEPNNNTFAGADHIGIDNSISGACDATGPGFDIDYYQVQTSSDGYLDVRLTDNLPHPGQQCPAIFFFECDTSIIISATIIDHSNGGCTDIEAQSRGVQAGLYYIEIRTSWDGNPQTYNFTDNLIEPLEPTDQEPDDNYTEANSLKVNSSATGHILFICCGLGCVDAYDYYKIQTTEAGNFSASVKFSGDPNEAVLFLYSSDGTTVIEGRDGYPDSSLIYDNLPSGTYYLALQMAQLSDGNAVGYTLYDSLFVPCVSPSISISSIGNTTVCKPATVMLISNVTGTPGTFQWKKGNNNISGATNSTYSATKTGTYKCIITNACGSATSNSISVTVNQQPDATITPSGTVDMCAGQTTVLTANSGSNLSYQWMKGSKNIPGATNQTYRATAAGKYEVDITNTQTTCSKTSKATTISITCRQDESQIADNGFSVYPNPCNGKFQLNFSTNEKDITITIEVINLVGQIILQQQETLNNGELMKEVSLPENTAPGFYEIKILDGTNVFQKELIYQK